MDGDHDTHIYISCTQTHSVSHMSTWLMPLVEIPKRLSEQIKSLVTSLQASLPDVHLHTYLSTSTELHVSLSHAFPLRQSQIPQFRTDLTRALQLHGAKSRGATPLRVSLGGKIRVYRNGRRYGGDGHGGRTFLALQVGAGAKEVSGSYNLAEGQIDGIVQAVIHPLLKTLHRPLYHSDPEYHASFAWCLTEEGGEVDARVDRGGSDVMTYPTADPVHRELLRRMDVEFESGILGAQPPLGWVIDKLVVKIGKDVLKVPL